METHWLSGKEKILASALSKEGHVDSVLEMKERISVDFLEKGTIVSSAS